MNTTLTNRLNETPARITQAVIVGLLALAVFPAGLQANTIENIEYSQIPSGGTQLKVSLSESAVEPSGFTIDQPPRLVLDFAGVTSGLDSNKLEMGLDLTRSLVALKGDSRTRLVVSLNKAAGWSSQTEGNNVFVTIDPVQAAALDTAAAPGQNSIVGVDFNRGTNGEARISVGLSSENINIDSREEPGQFVVEFLNASLPVDLARRLTVTDFGTPATAVETQQIGSTVRMVIEAHGDYDVLAYQTEQNYTVEVQPLAALSGPELARQKKSFDGERLSLNFQNIEVRSVLQLLADFTGKNLVASDTVTGTVTLRLKNVPWDQALDIILSTKGLAKREDGNVMWVAPAEEIAARERLELEAQQQLEELAPLYTEYIAVNFARAVDLSALISADENNLLTERGNITIDERTNSLIVHDTEDKIAEIRQLVNTLDVPVQQVLIESRIVNASTDFSKNLGVRFGGTKTGDAATSTRAISGNLNATTQASNGDDLEFDDRLNINMPAGGIGGIGANSIAFAISKADRLLELELSALEAEGKGEILSNPRVVTSNQREAVISQGTQIAYQEASSSGATSTSFQDAVLSLRVTPQITPDDHIIMDLEVSKDAVGALVGGVPTIDTQNINTQVLVDNGDTIVIGGIYEQTQTQSATRTPFLGELPYVGFLFRTTAKTNDKSELLIFITPKILRDGLAAAL
ncbi:MAG: type IV pilus secretin PilQ [Immundisolibacteraceae bacterium]|nr:type IV pilus secretin PilQ [Immundisolibacteraceae bacterium]